MEQPVAVGDALQQQLGRIRDRQHLHRATPEALLPDDYDDLPAAVGSMLADQRTATWQRAIPNRFQWATLADFTGPEADRLADWAARPAGRNLLLLGAVGVGKSHAAVAAVRPAHFDRGADVRFLPVVELLDLLRPGGPEGALYDLADTDVLVVDDLGTERSTDWTDERLYAVINRRWLEERPTAATSNLEPKALRDALGARTYSRLVGNGAVVVTLDGPDRRRQHRA